MEKKTLRCRDLVVEGNCSTCKLGIPLMRKQDPNVRVEHSLGIAELPAPEYGQNCSIARRNPNGSFCEVILNMHPAMEVVKDSD